MKTKPRRTSVADEAFDELARAILSGELPAGSKLPSERELAETLGASRVLIRQAIHQLGDMGLLRVRQGAATRVEPLSEMRDVRVLELLYRLGGNRAEMDPYVVERQYMNGASLLELAELRGTDAQRAEVLRVVQEEAPQHGDPFLPFEQKFWHAVAAATNNPIFQMELTWWYRVVGDSMPRPSTVVETPLALRIAFHRELARRLIARDETVAYYLSVVRPILDALEIA